jgi:hypothetical protein
MALKSFLTDPEQRAGGEAHGEDLDEKDYALLRAYIANGTVTLHELYARVGDVFGDRLEEIHEPGARGEMRSCIRNVCRRSAEFLDGTPVKLLIHNYHKRVQPRGTHSGSRRG